MKFLLICMVGLLIPASAQAEYRSTALESVASQLAMRPVEVRCATEAEDEIMSYAWGYVYLWTDYMTLNAMLCRNLENLVNGKVSARHYWRTAIAVLVLAHEARHLRLADNRGSEGHTENWAIRHFTVTARLLGAPVNLTHALKGWALAFHFKLVGKYPEYDCPKKTKGCKKVPWYFPRIYP